MNDGAHRIDTRMTGEYPHRQADDRFPADAGILLRHIPAEPVAPSCPDDEGYASAHFIPLANRLSLLCPVYNKDL
jgi:hypothetical protein